MIIRYQSIVTKLADCSDFMATIKKYFYDFYYVQLIPCRCRVAIILVWVSDL